MEGDEEPWSISGLAGVGKGGDGRSQFTDRLGWNAMPFALEDLDSNYTKQLSQYEVNQGIRQPGDSTFVSMVGPDCMLTGWWPKPRWSCAGVRADQLSKTSGRNDIQSKGFSIK